MGKIADIVSNLEHKKGVADYILSETQAYFTRLKNGGEDPAFIEWFTRRLKDYHETN